MKATKNSLTNCPDLDNYIDLIKSGKIRTSKEIKAQFSIVEKEFKEDKIFIDTGLYEKYIKIGLLFFDDIFPFQRAITALSLCTFYKDTKTPRWNKVLNLWGRGNGKDGTIAWWSCCLTSVYHGIERYNVDIVANNMTQSLRPLEDIRYMVKDKDKQQFYERIGDSVVSKKTNSYINAMSSDAKMLDGLRSGAVVFNEIHAYENYAKINVLKTGLGKVEEPRTFYFTTNGEIRGSVLDDMLDTASDVLSGVSEDRGMIYFIYQLDTDEEVNDKENWEKANPAIKYRPALASEIDDEYFEWLHNQDTHPAFMQKRMNRPIQASDQVVVPWEVILKTNQPINYESLQGKSCIVGIDLSRTTDWTAYNMLFYDEKQDKYVCINHAYICAKNKDLSGIKAPYMEWVKDGYCTLVNEVEVSPEYVVNEVFSLAKRNGYNIQGVVIDTYRKGLMMNAIESFGYTKDNGGLKLIRPSDIAQILPTIERVFLNERFIWDDNPCLRWATNNTKVISWKKKTTGDNELGNQMYGKINQRFRKTDPFMALVHSMCMSDELAGEGTIDLLKRGF